MIAIVLFHGRRDPLGSLEDWGSDGPVFLVSWVHVTYLSRLAVGLADDGGDAEISLVEDLVYYDGVYYGDWSVMPAEGVTGDAACAARIVPFDPKKAVR